MTSGFTSLSRATRAGVRLPSHVRNMRPHHHQVADHRRPAKTGWIPTTEQLPVDEGFVLVCVNTSYEPSVTLAFWDTKVFWEHNWPWTPNDISHWMHLPSAPFLSRDSNSDSANPRLQPSSNRRAVQILPIESRDNRPKPQGTGTAWITRLLVIVLLWTAALLVSGLPKGSQARPSSTATLAEQHRSAQPACSGNTRQQSSVSAITN
jgi:hypothetical protein